MSECRRHVCTNDADGETFCSERCKRMYDPGPSPDDIERHGDYISQANQESRNRIINNKVNADK